MMDTIISNRKKGVGLLYRTKKHFTQNLDSVPDSNSICLMLHKLKLLKEKSSEACINQGF